MTVCCKPCYERRGLFVPAVNLGDVWRCDSCAEAVWERQQARDVEAWHGGASWMGSAQIERAKADGGMR